MPIPSPIEARLEELASLARLADVLAITAAGEASARCYAQAAALRVRIGTLTAGISHDLATMRDVVDDRAMDVGLGIANGQKPTLLDGLP